MKNALLIAGIALASFLVGFVLLTYKMPSVAPQRAEEARQYVDSIMTATGRDGQTDSLAAPVESAPDSLRIDSMGGIVADSNRQRIAMAALEKASAEGIMAVLRDSLRRVTARVHALTTENQTLRQDLNRVKNGASPKASPEEVATLTATLAKLDDKQLRPILKDVDGVVLEQLYRSASGRTQARLIEAMPADRAASFVRKLVQGTDGSGSPSSGTGGTTSPPKTTGTR